MITVAVGSVFSPRVIATNAGAGGERDAGHLFVEENGASSNGDGVGQRGRDPHDGESAARLIAPWSKPVPMA